jgi:hypothetical protein
MKPWLFASMVAVFASACGGSVDEAPNRPPAAATPGEKVPEQRTGESPAAPRPGETTPLSSCAVDAVATAAARDGVDGCSSFDTATSLDVPKTLGEPIQGFYVGHDALVTFDPSNQEPASLLVPTGWTYPVAAGAEPVCTIATYRRQDRDGWKAGEFTPATSERAKGIFDTRAKLAAEQGRPLCDYFTVSKQGQYVFVAFVAADGALMLVSPDGGYGKFTPGQPVEASAAFQAIK